MRLSDESTEKFEIELANEQVKKIKQAINDCQLRFGKVMGCGTCKALQLCTWAKELSSTIESMGKYIEALQQENEQLRAQVDEWKYEVKCHMDEVAARDKEIERLKAQVDTLSATVNMLAPDEIGKECRHIEALRKAREVIKAAWSDGSANAAMDKASEALAEIDKAIGGKEDV